MAILARDNRLIKGQQFPYIQSIGFQQEIMTGIDMLLEDRFALIEIAGNTWVKLAQSWEQERDLAICAYFDALKTFDRSAWTVLQSCNGFRVIPAQKHLAMGKFFAT